MKKTKDDWIKQLKLEFYPEGGYYMETYRNSVKVESENGERNLATSMYYIVEEKSTPFCHRITSDEILYYHDGGELDVYLIDAHGNLTMKYLGIDSENAKPCVLIPANTWFGYKTKGEFTLMTCIVLPGFDIRDATIVDRNELIEQFPHHKDFIVNFTLKR